MNKVPGSNVYVFTLNNKISSYYYLINKNKNDINNSINENEPPPDPKKAMSLTRKISNNDDEILQDSKYKFNLSIDTLLTNSATTRLARVNKKRGIDIPPRPQNAWIIYRRDKSGSEEFRGLKSSQISKKVAELWKNEPEEVKMLFEALARIAEKKHIEKYGDGYKYKPKKPKNLHKKREEVVVNPIEQPFQLTSELNKEKLFFSIPATSPPSTTPSTPLPLELEELSSEFSLGTERQFSSSLSTTSPTTLSELEKTLPGSSISPIIPSLSEFVEIRPDVPSNTVDSETSESSKSSVSPKSPRSLLESTEKLHSPVTPSLSEVMKVEQQASPTSMELEEKHIYKPGLRKKREKKKLQEEKLSMNEDLAPAISSIYSHSISTLEETSEQQAIFVASTPMIKDQEKMPENILNEYNPNNQKKKKRKEVQKENVSMNEEVASAILNLSTPALEETSEQQVLPTSILSMPTTPSISPTISLPLYEPLELSQLLPTSDFSLSSSEELSKLSLNLLEPPITSIYHTPLTSFLEPEEFSLNLSELTQDFSPLSPPSSSELEESSLNFFEPFMTPTYHIPLTSSFLEPEKLSPNLSELTQDFSPLISISPSSFEL